MYSYLSESFQDKKLNCETVWHTYFRSAIEYLFSLRENRSKRLLPLPLMQDNIFYLA